MSRISDTFGGGAPEDDSSSALSANGGAATPAFDEEPKIDSINDAAIPTDVDAEHQLTIALREPASRRKLVIDDETREAAPSHYEIPDFEKDARDLTAYEDAKRRHLRQLISTGERDIQTAYSQKRSQLTTELKNARSFEIERRGSAMHMTRQYASAYPARVDKKGVNPPSFFENLFSFGRAGRLYRAAFVASEALDQLRVAIRKRDEALGALEGQMSRAIYLKEESIKKSMESQIGIDEFHDRPEIKTLWRRIEAVERERATFAHRLDRRGVSDEELRDRVMAENKLEYAALPIMGAIIARVARFGNMAYFQLRDLEKKESLLSYDSRLDPLRNSVFDVYSVAGTVASKLKRNDNGTAFRVADHFKACWRNQDKAEELYSQHRSALREDRGLAAQKPRDEAEAEVLERLATLAGMIEGGTSPPAGSGGRGLTL